MKKVLLFVASNLGYSALAFLAFQAALVVTQESIWQFGWSTLIGIIYVFLSLFLFRAAEEIRAAQADTVPKEKLTQRKLWTAVLASALLGIGLSALVSSGLAFFALCHMALSIAWIAWGRKFPAFVANRMFPVLLACVSANVLMNLYNYLLTRDTQGAPEDLRALIAWLAVFAAARLQYEFASRTIHPEHQQAGMQTFSGVLGTYPSLGLAVLFSLAAAMGAIEIVMVWKIHHWPLLSYFLFSPMILCLYIPRFIRFRRVDSPERPAMLTRPGMMALAFFLFFVILYTAAT